VDALRIADRFEIGDEVASGGMGRVYRSVDRASGVPVAVKLLQSRYDEPRFAREAALLERLEHPLIARYIAHGVTAGGRPYLVMEWIDGPTLGQAIEETGVTPRDAGIAGRRIAEGLAYVHDRGVLHRDVKPGNIMIPGGVAAAARLIDFGIARSAGEAGLLTRTGTVIGTPGFMSPEQAVAEPDLDGKTDVFSLGCVLYLALTGRFPFAGDNGMAIRGKLLFVDPPGVAARKPELPPWIDQLVAAMMRKEAGARPAVAEVAEALERPLPDLGAVTLVTGDEPTTDERPAPGARQPAAADIEVDSVIAVAPIAELDSRVGVALRSAAAGAGARIELLADGSALCALSGRGDPLAEALRAARCALALQGIAGAAVSLAVTPSRGVARGIDRSVATLTEVTFRRLDGDRPDGAGVWIDEATAAILEGRVTVERIGERVLLQAVST
jgi:hypothetical protein